MRIVGSVALSVLCKIVLNYPKKKKLERIGEGGGTEESPPLGLWKMRVKPSIGGSMRGVGDFRLNVFVKMSNLFVTLVFGHGSTDKNLTQFHCLYHPV